MADPTLTPLQVASMAWLAGWPADDLATVTAIAGAESSFDPENTNPSGAKGLLQILEPAHPEFKKEWDSPGTIWGWDDPLRNLWMGLQVYKAKGNFSPWVTYGGARYNDYLPAATQAAQQVQDQIKLSGTAAAQRWAFTRLTPTEQAATKQIDAAYASVGQAVAGAGNELGSTISATGPALGSAVGDLTANFANLSTLFGNLLLPSFWLRILCGVLGVGAVTGGVLLLGKEAKAAE